MDNTLLLLSAAMAVVLTLWAPSCHAWFFNPSGRQVQLLTGKEQLVVDSLLDNVLVTVQKEIAHSTWDVANLPNVATTQGQLSLKGTEGLIHSLSSIARASSAVISYGNGNVSLSTAFSLTTLEMSYHVEAKYLFLSKSADVGATISRNSVKLTAGIYYYGDVCYVAVDSLAVDVLDGFKWRVSGFGPINSIVAAAVSALVSPEKLKNSLNASFNSALRKYKAPCLALIPGVNKDYVSPC